MTDIPLHMTKLFDTIHREDESLETDNKHVQLKHKTASRLFGGERTKGDSSKDNCLAELLTSC